MYGVERHIPLAANQPVTRFIGSSERVMLCLVKVLPGLGRGCRSILFYDLYPSRSPCRGGWDTAT